MLMAQAAAGPSTGRSRTARRRGRFAAAALLIPALAACGTTDAEAVDPLAAQKIVTKLPARAGQPAPDAAAEAARAESQFAAAQAAWQAGDAVGALAIANRALVEGVPPALEGGFRDLRAKARAAVVASKVCRVRVLPEKDAVADGTPVAIRIEFANLSGATLRVPHGLEGSSDACVVLTLERQDVDVFGSERTTSYTLSAPVDEDLELAPGAAHVTRLEVPAAMTTLDHEGFSVLAFSGTFRPVALRVGDSEFFDAIPIERAAVRIFQKGFEPLAADPLGSLRKAIEKRSPPHVLTCVELLAPSDRAAAKSLLETARQADPPLALVIDASLARIALAR
jgi:hypothetical protein